LKPSIEYLAGFVDGEGCFFIGLFNTVARPGASSYPNYHTLLKISNNNFDVLQWLYNEFGGSIDKRIKKQRLRKNELPSYSLEFTGNTLTNICYKLLPYLFVKKEHCKIMIRMRETFPVKRGKVFVSDEFKAIRQECHLAIRKLNTRFHDHPFKKVISPCAMSSSLTLPGVPCQSEQV